MQNGSGMPVFTKRWLRILALLLVLTGVATTTCAVLLHPLPALADDDDDDDHEYALRARKRGELRSLKAILKTVRRRAQISQFQHPIPVNCQGAPCVC